MCQLQKCCKFSRKIWQAINLVNALTLAFGKFYTSQSNDVITAVIAKMDNGIVQGSMDIGICDCLAYGAFWMPTDIERIISKQQMVNIEDPYTPTCNCCRFFQYAARTPLPAISTSYLAKDPESLLLLCFSSDLICFLCSAIDYRTVYINGGKFGEPQTTHQIAKFKSSPNLQCSNVVKQFVTKFCNNQYFSISH